jgi:Flp pilus assembly protein protease CpaA
MTMPTSLEPAGYGAAIQFIAAGGALLCLLAAAIEDGWRYRISNLLVVGVAVCFAAYAAAEGSWPFLGWSLAAGICMLAVASIPFAFGVFGGGDTKLIAVMALWTQFAGLPRFLVVMSAFGGVLCIVWLARKLLGKATGDAAPAAAQSRAGPQPEPEPEPEPLPASAPAAQATEGEAAAEVPAFSRVPYGIAIALAGIDFFAFAPTSPFAGWLSL